MKKLIFIIPLLIGLFTSIVVDATSIAPENEYVIGYKNKSEAVKIISHLKGDIVAEYDSTNILLFRTRVKESIIKEKKILFIEKNELVYGASTESTETSELGQKETIPWGISAINADIVNKNGVSGNGINVAILDTGVDYKHADLKISGGVSFVPNKPDYMDDNDHGTHLAGIIAGQPNGFGITGAAPSVNLYAVKVLDQYKRGTISQVIEGIDWSIKNGMNIINLSLMNPIESEALKQACQRAYESGVLIIAAAGNSGGGDGEIDTISYPANYDSVISVGAINEDFERSTFSAVGVNLEFTAPGEKIFSTIRNNRYSFLSGTSMAAAHATSVASLIWSVHPTYSNINIRKLMQSYSERVGSKREYGYGVVNANIKINCKNKQFSGKREEVSSKSPPFRNHKWGKHGVLCENLTFSR